MATTHVPLAAIRNAADPSEALRPRARLDAHLLDACRRCREACWRLAQADGAETPTPDLARTLLATSRLAMILAKYASDRDESQRLGPIVARACERTARACSRSGEDPRLRECAEACSGCVDALRPLLRGGRRPPPQR